MATAPAPDEFVSSDKFEKKQLSAEDVISKLKDDGDFDRLRHKIIHKLKSNEDLRNSIISIVKRSAALNCMGADKLKPRQLFDSIHKEIESEVMGQISDGVWEVIRSNDGMKKEITETVESVYEKLTNKEKGKAPEDIPMPSADEQPPNADKEAANHVIPHALSSTVEVNTSCDGSEPNEPPGFFLCNQKQPNILEGCKEQPRDPPHEVPKEHYWDPSHEVIEVQPQEVAGDALESSYSEPTEPHPVFSTVVGDNSEPLPNNDSDSDPDVPPGFGWTINHHFSSSK